VLIRSRRSPAFEFCGSVDALLRFSKNETNEGLGLRDTLSEEPRYELFVLEKTRQDNRL
jgi:hypothetical protein